MPSESQMLLHSVCAHMIREVAQRMETTHCNAFRNVCRLDVCSLLLQLLTAEHASWTWAPRLWCKSFAVWLETWPLGILPLSCHKLVIINLASAGCVRHVVMTAWHAIRKPMLCAHMIKKVAQRIGSNTLQCIHKCSSPSASILSGSGLRCSHDHSHYPLCLPQESERQTKVI